MNQNNKDFENDISSKSEDFEKDIFSYDNSNNIIDNDGEDFDLNSFSSNNSNASPRKKTVTNSKTKKQRIIKIALTVFLIGVITVTLVVGCFMFYAFTMVDGKIDNDLNNLELNFTTTIYVDEKDGNYKEYQRLHGQYNRIWVDYNRTAAQEKQEGYEGIPERLATAFIAIEDQRFREHEGVDWKRTMGAFINEFIPIYSSRQGGSTITQQLVKNLTDDRSQKASRKVREIMRARYVESNYSKDTILECYLNTIAMGNGTYGVEVASNYYFSKSVKDLTVAECATLAAIAKSPTYYAPDDYPEENKQRRMLVLKAMKDQQYITNEEYEKAKTEEVKIVADTRVLSNNKINSYFIDALITQVSNDLSEKYGYEPSYADNLFYSGGFKIYATIDPEIQEKAEQVYSNTEKYKAPSSKGDPLMSGITIMDYKGNVKAIVGGFGEKTDNRGWNSAIDAVRQPGSSIKPISVYAPAIETDEITYSTIVNDTKTKYKDWTPVNSDRAYMGNITVQVALAKSRNTVPVYLVNKMGPQFCFDFLTEKFGVKTLNKNDVDLSPLGMGGTNGGINTLQSAAAFAAFGNGGKYYEPSFYTKITNHDGDIILQRKTQPVTAISEDTATIMNHLLQTVTKSGGTGASASSYVSSMPLFGKTGTSNSKNDLWFVGGSPYYVASCWSGYKTQQSVASKYGNISLKIWGDVMAKIHSGLSAKDFTDSDYTVKRYYCTSSGKLATSACTSKAVGWYKKSNIPDACSTHIGETLKSPDEIAKEEQKKQEESKNETSSSSSGTSSTTTSSNN